MTQNKTLEEKIEEKKKSICQIDSIYDSTMELYDTIVSNYNSLYQTNHGKDLDDHMNGISAILRRLNDLIETKNKIQNEINNMVELAEIPQNEENNQPKGKEAILNLINGGNKRAKALSTT